MTKEVVYDAEWFNVIDMKDSESTFRGIEPKSDNIIVLPYVLNENGILQKVGLNWECNQLRTDSFSYTVVTGDVDDTDETSFDAAIRELLEEGGYEVLRSDRDHGSHAGFRVRPVMQTSARDGYNIHSGITS